jgi:two-component system response regulator GlrR
VISASNIDLEKAVRAGRFRQDLYYRLNVIQLKLPPLRRRTGDIPLLARHFAGECAARIGRPAREFTPAAMQKLMLYSWPGNVRELENVIERAIVLADSPRIEAKDIQVRLDAAEDEKPSFRVLKARAVAQFEKAYLEDMLAAHDGNITRAAAAARKPRRAFWQLMRKYDLTSRTRASAL